MRNPLGGTANVIVPIDSWMAVAIASDNATEDQSVVLQPADDQTQPPIVPPPISDSTPLAVMSPANATQVLQLELPPDVDTPRDAPMVTTGVRLDAATLRMLEALMEDEERSTKSEMIRLLIRRAYRARFIQMRPDAPGASKSAP